MSTTIHTRNITLNRITASNTVINDTVTLHIKLHNITTNISDSISTLIIGAKAVVKDTLNNANIKVSLPVNTINWCEQNKVCIEELISTIRKWITMTLSYELGSTAKKSLYTLNNTTIEDRVDTLNFNEL